MTDICTIYVTIDSKANAQTLLTSLLEARLVACGNILGPFTSSYWWEGRIEQAEEYALLLKTRTSLYEAAQRFIDDHHPYDIPCILRWDVADGHAPFLEWVAAQTVV